jgi:hypothetical protein
MVVTSSKIMLRSSRLMPFDDTHCWVALVEMALFFTQNLIPSGGLKTQCQILCFASLKQVRLKSSSETWGQYSIYQSPKTAPNDLQGLKLEWHNKNLELSVCL